MENIQYRPGTLAAIGDIRELPITGDTLAIAPRKVKSRDESCPLLFVKDRIQSRKSLNTVLAYHVSRFFPEETHHDIRLDRLLVCATGLLANLCDWGNLTPWASMKQAFQDLNTNIIFQEMSPDELANMMDKDTRAREFLTMWGDDIDYVLGDTSVMIVYALILLLIMGKNVDRNNASGWFKNRVRGFSGALGESNIPNFITAAFFPHLDTLIAYSSAIHSAFNIRRVLFTTAVSIAASAGQSKIQIGIIELIHLLRCTEMNHLILIDKYLYSTYPELRALSMLTGLDAVYGTAIDYLKSLPSSERNYVRILRQKDETSLLNRNRFELAVVAATACAQYESATFNSYFTSDNREHVRLATQVKGYLRYRTDLIKIAAGDHSSSRMGIHEEKQFFIRAIKDFIDNTKEEEKTDTTILHLPSGAVTL